MKGKVAELLHYISGTDITFQKYKQNMREAFQTPENEKNLWIMAIEEEIHAEGTEKISNTSITQNPNIVEKRLIHVPEIEG